MKKVKERDKQINKEALISLGLYVFFFVWWYGFAYGLGLKEPQNYNYILGMPSWFFFSCVLGYVVISFATWFIVKRFFVEIPFDEEENGLEE